MALFVWCARLSPHAGSNCRMHQGGGSREVGLDSSWHAAAVLVSLLLLLPLAHPGKAQLACLQQCRRMRGLVRRPVSATAPGRLSAP